eukprot:scaffold24.g2951.t1
MATFLRPGELRPAAFGVSFEDRGAAAGAVPVYNKNERLALGEQRARLPIAAHRTEILYLVEAHATTVIVGETGSGKTTQIPQYLAEAGWTAGGKMIACTQPRRVAAMTVAARVAEEVGCRLGQQVGYSIRFEDVSTPGVTQLRFCTDGMLLREMMGDPLLRRYSVVMVDEAHERSLATDVLLGLLKKVQRRRADLRVIISSATMDAERMARQGVHYLERPTSNYLQSAVEAAVAVHQEGLPGDILIFLTGQQECEAAVALLEEEGRRLRRQGGQQRLRLAPVPLYAGMPAAHQLGVFEPAPRGYRKVVVATNIAETSVTIEGVVFVVDCCFAKQRCYNPLTGLESLLVAPISRASAAQRAGRAGRLRPGHALRLCTEAAFAALPETSVPEMRRSDLAGTVLQLKSLGVDNMMGFEWLAAPPAEAMVRALECLHALGALDGDAKLTKPLGVHMAELPLEPALARMLLAGAAMKCAREVATVVAMLSVQSVWAPGERRALDEAKSRFGVAEGDLISFLNVWKAWDESGRSRRWAAANFVSHRSMLRAADVRGQLEAHLRRLGLPLHSALAEQEREPALGAVRRACAAGLFINAARLTEELSVKTSDAEDAGASVYRLVRSAGGAAASVRLRIHHSSVLFRCRPPWVCFYSAEQNDAGWYEMREVHAIESGWLTELAPHMYRLVPVNPSHRLGGGGA